MELPEDILALIRIFSKPRMKFYKEYRTSLTELGFAPHEHWIVLRNKLCTSDADQVFGAFIAYKDTAVLFRKLKNSPFKVPKGPQLYYIFYYEEFERQKMKLNKLDRELRVLLVGEERVLRHEQLTENTEFD
jgi:hypothetical protein